MTDPRVDPHGTTPGAPFGPSGSPSGAPAAGAVTSGWPGRPEGAAEPPPRSVPVPSAGKRGGRADSTDRTRPGATTQALPRTRVPGAGPEPVTGTFEPPSRPPGPPPRTRTAAAGTTVPPPGSAPAGGTRAGTSARRPAGSRKARLRLTRIDPWSALKTSLVFSGFLFIVWMVAVIVLFLVLTVVGTFDSINSTLSDVLGTHVDFNGGVIIGIALVVGALSVVLVSALGTIMAFAYNVTASLIGGVDVTLTESDR